MKLKELKQIILKGGDKKTMKTKIKQEKGITLIALVITIVVLLILAGVSINAIFSENGIINKAKDAQNKMNQATQNDLIGLNELDKLISSLTDKTTEETVPKIAMFDTGKKVRDKMYNLMPEGTISKFSYSCNVSIDAIEKYNGVPDLTKLTEANIVSLGESSFPIYMWAEKSGKTEIRNPVGMKGLTAEGDNDSSKKVETGKIYWWSESDSVYLNPDSAQMFAGIPYLTNIDGLKDMKTDCVVNMSNMFYSLGTQLSNIDALSGWNTSKVENMSDMFYRWSFTNSLSNVNALLNWDTSKVKNMSSMFAGNNELTDIEGLKKWNTSNVTDMHNMFGDADSGGCAFTNLSAISNWNVKNVTNMTGMFYMCSKLEDISEIWNWNITEIAQSMFLSCSNLKTITIPSTITKINSMAFQSCSNLTQIKILAADATKFEVGNNVFDYIASNSKIYVLSEEIKAKLEGNYDTSKTTVEVVTLEQMNNL